MRARQPNPSRHRGATLVELVIAIVIVAVAVAGVLQVMNLTTQHSADPMVREQAQLIAEAYMEEILLKPFVDPNTGQVCTPATAGRANFNKVCDYTSLTNAAVQDQFGTPIGALNNYTVTVTVTPNAANPAGVVALGNIDNTPPPLVRVLRIDITVTGPGGTSVPLTGYRTDYDCNWGTGVNCSVL